MLLAAVLPRCHWGRLWLLGCVLSHACRFCVCNRHGVTGAYCPEGTSTPPDCGSVDVFCPDGAASPTRVQSGHYTLPIGGTVNQVSEQRCDAGYVCNGGVRGNCGNVAQHCPAGSTTPTLAVAGEYTTPTGVAAEANRVGVSSCGNGTSDCVCLLA